MENNCGNSRNFRNPHVYTVFTVINFTDLRVRCCGWAWCRFDSPLSFSENHTSAGRRNPKKHQQLRAARSRRYDQVRSRSPPSSCTRSKRPRMDCASALKPPPPREAKSFEFKYVSTRLSLVASRHLIDSGPGSVLTNCNRTGIDVCSFSPWDRVFPEVTICYLKTQRRSQFV